MTHATLIFSSEQTVVPKIVLQPMQSDPFVPQPVLGAALGEYECSVLCETGTLSQFGAHIEVLAPGSHSSLHHLHKTKDVIHYPNHDLISHKDGDARRYTHAGSHAFDTGAKHE